MKKVVTKRKSSVLKLSILLVISILFITVGYSSLSTTLSINGSAAFKPVGMIRVISFEKENLVDVDEVSNNFTKDSISVLLDFKNTSGYATYNVKIANLGQTDKILLQIKTELISDENFEYSIENLKENDVIKEKETKEFKITFKYKNTTDSTKLNAKIRFAFADYSEVLPVGTKGYLMAYSGDESLFGFSKDNIYYFKRNSKLTKEEVLEKNGVKKISNESTDEYNSDYEIYAWVEDNTFYWWSEADLVYFHPKTLKAFKNYKNIKTIDLTGLSTEKVENFAHFFDTNTNLKEIKGRISTRGLKLEYNDNFNYRNDSSNDSSSEKGLAYMFNDCKVLESVDISGIVTTNASDMKRMFAGCYKLKNIDVSNFDTKNVKSMYWMFRKDESLTDVDLTNFNTENVENMFGMFVQDTNIETIRFGDNFNTSKVKNMKNMFYDLKKLKTIYVQKDFELSSDLVSQSMFYNTTSLVGSLNEEYAFAYDSKKQDATYAKIATSEQNGYFTYALPREKYNIIYDLNGGNADNPKFYYKDGKSFTLNNPIKEGYTFIGWTGSNGDAPQMSVTIETNESGDKNYFANYKEDLGFDTVFAINGSCNLNGSEENITGDSCSEYHDQKYIDTKINLFSEENYKKDFEIYFEISNYDPKNQESGVTQQTIMNSLPENGVGGLKGLVYRRNGNNLQIISRNSTTKEINRNYVGIEKVRIVRKDGNMYYAVNDEKLQLLNSFEDFNTPYNLPVWFGASMDSSGNAFRYTKCTLSNIHIKLGKYTE